MSSKIVLWSPKKGVKLPSSLTTASEIAPHAKQLTKRELNQLVTAFESGNFEMGSLFLWSKTMAGLKKQLASLGMVFIGEMLERPDISNESIATEVLTDHEAVKLAEELGMFTSAQAMRLRRVLEMISFFSNPPSEDDEEEDREMMPEEAMQCLRVCIQNVLGHERLEGAIQFAEFRDHLEEKAFSEEDDEIQSLITSPYFFQRTALRVLLAMVKTSDGAQLENALSNITLIVPIIWDGLLKSDRWLVGRAYAEVHAEGKKTAAAGIRKALLKVKGFDYVPEDLRSRAFLKAAVHLQNIHFSNDNFYNEPVALKNLSSLGSVIPVPALSQCITAILCVRIGNPWGVCWSAQPNVKKILKNINESRWKYYFDDCLPGDDIILKKLQDSDIAERWCEFIDENDLEELQLEKKISRDLLSASRTNIASKVTTIARKIYKSLTTGSS